MTPKHLFVRLVAFGSCLSILLSSAARASVGRVDLQRKALVVELKLSDLRSACLVRQGAVRYSAGQNSPEGIRRQLERHFDTVLGLLLVATPQSVETALDRLQSSLCESWSNEERDAWRQRLLANRYLQFLRLKAYRDRGLFPLNEGQSARPAPIFVDRYDTACAVGHLMRLSGWNESVAKVHESDNLVYVPEALASPVGRWILASGLTLEEAALIQPAYSFPAEFDFSEYGPGGAALEKNGLRFENFELLDVLGTGPLPQADGLGLLTGVGNYYGPSFGSPAHYPAGTHWLAIGGDRFTGDPDTALHSLGAYGAGNVYFHIRFDVSTISPHDRINQIAQTSYLLQDGFRRFGPGPLGSDLGQFYFYSYIYAGANLVGDLYLDETSTPQNGFNFQLTDSAAFVGEQHLTVDTYLQPYNGTFLDTYLIDFNVVPEPAALALSACGLVGFVSVRAGRRHNLGWRWRSV